MKKFFLFLAIIFLNADAYAQNRHKIDSLYNVLKKNIPDSIRADTYYYLARECWDYVSDPAVLFSNQNKAIEYANQCLTISEHCSYVRGMGDACRILWSVNIDRGKNIDALEWNKKALKYYRETGDDVLIASTLFRMGYTYMALNDYEQALKYDFEALKLDEQRGDSAEAAGLYHNIGTIYAAAGNRKGAIASVKKALSINKVTGNKDWLARNYVALGDYYFHDNMSESLEYYIESSKLFFALGNIREYAFQLVQVGNVLSHTKEYARAIDTLQKALRILREVQDKNGIAWSYNHLGMSYTQQKKFKEATVCLDSCLRLCKELGVPTAMRNVY